MHPYQSEGAEDGKSFDVGKAEFNKAQNYDDDVETAPLVLQVLVEAERDYLECGLGREYARKHLSPLDRLDCRKVKGLVLSYSFPSVRPGADPGLQAVSPQDVTKRHHHPAVGCHYFPPGLRLPSQPKSVTVHRPVPNYTAR